MDRTIEKKLAQQAVEFGRSGNREALSELLTLLASKSSEVRRLAVSAIGKLAGIADTESAVASLIPFLRDPHPQVRQYTIKALTVYGVAAEKALPDLRDISAAANEKDYNRRDAQKAIETIEEALRIARDQAEYKCQRCGVRVEADEFIRSQKAFDRVYCDRCFDEVYLQRRNFDTKVELNKTIRTRDGRLVQSEGERLIANFLQEKKIAYRYDERIRIIEGCAIRPDFYLPELDVYIEYWGIDTIDYKIGMLKKQQIYQQEGKRLISLYPADKPRIAEILKEKLCRYAHLKGDGATERSRV